MPIKPIPRSTRGVRYVDASLANPNDNSRPSGNDMVGVLKPIPAGRSSAANRSSSPYTFVPIGANPGEDNGEKKRFLPSPSPVNYRKSTSSPAMTTTTVGTYESYASLVSRGSPTISDPMPPLSTANIYQRNNAISPLATPTFQDGNVSNDMCRPVTSFARKSPIPKKKSPFIREDDGVRKKKVKTEICINVLKGRPCPFKDSPGGCCFAHSEEELQMTKLMDLGEAGLVDVETYRIKPCLQFISTGSW